MKQYTVIQFNDMKQPNYYQSKNNIIMALNAGQYVWRNDVKEASIEDVRKILHCWARASLSFIVKTSHDLEEIDSDSLISIEKIFYSAYTVEKHCVNSTTVEFNFIPPVGIFKSKIINLAEGSKPTKAIIQKESYVGLLNACGHFCPDVAKEVASFVGDDSYPLKEGSDPHPEDVVKNMVY